MRKKKELPLDVGRDAIWDETVWRRGDNHPMYYKGGGKTKFQVAQFQIKKIKGRNEGR